MSIRVLALVLVVLASHFSCGGGDEPIDDASQWWTTSPFAPEVVLTLDESWRALDSEDALRPDESKRDRWLVQGPPRAKGVGRDFRVLFRNQSEKPVVVESISETPQFSLWRMGSDDGAGPGEKFGIGLFQRPLDEKGPAEEEVVVKTNLGPIHLLIRRGHTVEPRLECAPATLDAESLSFKGGHDYPFDCTNPTEVPVSTSLEIEDGRREVWVPRQGEMTTWWPGRTAGQKVMVVWDGNGKKRVVFRFKALGTGDELASVVVEGTVSDRF